MRCASCKKFLNPLIPPCGAYYCRNNHWQCEGCTAGTSDHCRHCGVRSLYVSIRLEPPTDLTAMEATTTSLDNVSNEATKGSSCTSISTSTANRNEDMATVTASTTEKPNALERIDSTSSDPKVDMIYVRRQPPQESSSDLLGCVKSLETSRRENMPASGNEAKDEEQNFYERSLKDSGAATSSNLGTQDASFCDISQSESFAKSIALPHDETQGTTSTTTAQSSRNALVLDSSLNTGLSDNESEMAELKSARTRIITPRCQSKWPAPVTCAVGSSTASQPCLYDPSTSNRVELPVSCPRQDYCVMQATAEIPAATAFLRSQKIKAQSSIDQRLDRVLGTMQEHGSPTRKEEEPLLASSSESSEFPTLLKSLQPSVNETAGTTSRGVSAVNCPHVYRAVFKPVTGRGLLPQRQCEPLSLAECPYVQSILEEEQHTNKKSLKATTPDSARCPITCPESFCETTMFVSDLGLHVMRNHSYISTERIGLGETKNFFIDPEVAKQGIMKMNVMFLLRDMRTAVDSGKMRDMSPLLVMSTRVSVNDLSGLKLKRKSTKEFLMIWVTGFNPSSKPLRICLMAIGCSSFDPPISILTFGDLFSIKNRQTVQEILEKHYLLLTKGEIKSLTKNGVNPLELQLLVDGVGC